MSWWLPCRCCGGILILCHAKGETPKGTGTVSRLNPADGSVIWTVDLGIDPATEHPRVGYRVAISASGAVYVVWAVSDNEGGTGAPISSTDAPSGGVVKLSPEDGSQLAFVEFPQQADFTAFAFFALPRIAIDDQNGPVNERIYATCDYNVDDYWLYRLDPDLSIVWGAGPTEVSEPAANARGVTVCVDASGNVYASNYSIGYIFKLDPDAALLATAGALDVLPLASIVDPGYGVRVTGQAGTFGDNPVVARGFNTSLVDHWNVSLFDFDRNPPGDWGPDPVPLLAAVNLGGVAILGSLGFPWDVTTGGTRYASLWWVDTFGNPVNVIGGTGSVGGWGNWTADGIASNSFDLAYNAETNSTFVAGSALTAEGGAVAAGMLGVAGWLAPVYTSPATGNFAWGIASR